MALCGNSTEQKIWNFLRAKGFNDCGTAGLMGNLYAESGLKPGNLQNTYEKKLGYTDAGYTAAVDNGSYTNFVRDSAGYGLAQWTYWSRKENLLKFAKAAGKSIGDLETQLLFLYKELCENYKAVFNILRTAGTVLEASNAVLLQYERPANQSGSVQAKRAEYAQKYYDKYVKTNNKNTGGNTMSNSKLVDYTKISPNKTSPRKTSIKKITIHHMAGNLSVETCGNVFAPTSRQASSNYGIGTDGRVGMYVEEKDRSWCSSSADNDNQAITIEVANDGGAPNWHVSDKALSKLIELCVDICKRNGISRLNYTGDKSGNLTMHKWFAATSCPGPYLESKFPYIAEQVNKQLGNYTASATGNVTNSDIVYTVVAGDTLSKIATKYGTTYQKLAEYNGISNPNVISVGQKIKIPSVSKPESKPTPTNTVANYSKGDIVNFTGNTHYGSSTATSGSNCKPGKAKITAIAKGAKHPYHLIRESGGGSTVYGWVNESDISGKTTNTTTAPSAKTHTVKKGDTLSAIATKYGTTVAKIVAANRSKYPKMTANFIVVGWVLKIPA